ncbi:unnamed protein product [Calypogeia fissa]
MGNPVRMELELSAPEEQHQQQPQQGKLDQLDSSKSLGREDPDAPLLSTGARAEDQQIEGGAAAQMAKKKAELSRVHNFEDDVKLMLHSKSGNSENESSAVDVRAAPDVRTTAAQSALVPVREEEITPGLMEEMEEKYAPFVREDTYGTFGRGPFPLLEKIVLGLALVTIVPIRVILMLFILVLYWSICKVCTLFRLPGEEEGQENYGYLTGVRRSVIVFTGRWLARLLLFVCGFYHIKVTHKTPEVMHRLDLGLGERETEDNEGLLETSKGFPGAIVSNHISYIDILYHMSASFPSFVAKRSVAKLPLIGLMSKCMGCVYVQRESKSPNFKGVSGIIKERLQAAYQSRTTPIFLLFPEGTTTNGDYLLPFKTGAFLAGTPIQPVLLKYPYLRFSPAWETISGVRHVILLLCQFVNHLEVTRLPMYYPNAKESSEPKVYANNVRILMSTEGDLRKSDIGLYEKRVYHAALAGKIFTRSDSSLR